MASTADIKNGLCIEFNNDIFTVIEFLHVKPGKGPAFVRTKLKSLTSGKVIDNTFPSGHQIQTVRIERRPHQYMYTDEMGMNFMDNETFDQVNLDSKLLLNPQFLREGDNVDILYHAEKNIPLTSEMPQYVVMQITYTEPAVAGNTATNATKPAQVETGATVNVPLFIKEGDRIKIDTVTGSYMERVNK